MELILHFAWTYFHPADRCQILAAYPSMRPYVALRLFAATQSVALLRRLRPPPGKPHHLEPMKAQIYGAALLRFNFVYGDFIRWLSGEYTNCHLDWATTFNTFAARKARPPPACSIYLQPILPVVFTSIPKVSLYHQGTMSVLKLRLLHEITMIIIPLSQRMHRLLKQNLR